MFRNLGNYNYGELEKFVCTLYGYPKYNSVDKVRASMCINKFKKDHQTLDLCNLPPTNACQKSELCFKYKHANRIMMELDDSVNHGWDKTGQAIWSKDPYPVDRADLLLDTCVYDEDDTRYVANDDDVRKEYEYDGSQKT